MTAGGEADRTATGSDADTGIKNNRLTMRHVYAGYRHGRVFGRMITEEAVFFAELRDKPRCC